MSLIKTLPTHFGNDALQKGANMVGSGSNENNYAECLNALPKYNKSAYRQAIIQRSDMVTNSYNTGEFKFILMQLFYIFFNKMIFIIPGLKKIIIATMV